MASSKNKIEIEILAEVKKAVADIAELKKTTGEAGAAAEKSGQSFSNSAVAIVAAGAAIWGLVSAGKEWVGLANIQEKAEKGLEAATARLGDASGTLAEKIKTQASALQEVSTFGDEMIISLQTGLLTAGLTADAVENLTPSLLDLAAAYELSGKGTLDLIALQKDFAKAIKTGQARLDTYGVVLTDVEKAQLKNSSETERAIFLQNKLEKSVGGSAATLAGTADGALTQFSNIVSDIKEGLGGLINEFLIPIVKVLKPVASYFSEIVNSAGPVPQILKAVGVGIGILAVGLGIYTVATSGAVTSTIAFTTALLANPIGLIIAGVAVLAAGLYALISNVDSVRVFFEDLWDSIKQGWSLVQPIFEELWEVLKIIGEIVWEVVVASFESLWDIISTVGEIIWDLIKSITGFNDEAGGSVDVLGLFKKAVDFVKNGILALKGTLNGTKAAFGAFKTTIGEVWDAIVSLDWGSIPEILSGGADKMTKAYKEGFSEVLTAKEDLDEELVKPPPSGGNGGGGGDNKAAQKQAEDLEKLKLDNMEEGLAKQQALIEASRKKDLEAAKGNKELEAEINKKYDKLAADAQKKHDDQIDQARIDAMSEGLAKEKAKRDAARQKELEAAGSNEDLKAEINTKYNNLELQAEKTLADQKSQIRIDTMTAGLDKELAQIKFNMEKELAAAGENAELRKAIEDKYAAQNTTAIEKDSKDKEKLAADETKKAKQLAQQEHDKKIGLAKSALTELSGLAGENFEAQKALSIAQATINTYEGATKAYAQGGPILGAILAAVVVAAGLANVAKIAAQKPPEKKSYRVGGYTGDGNPNETAGVVEYKEFVMNESATSQNRALLEKLNAGQSAADIFNMQLPSAPGFEKGGNQNISLKGEFKMKGKDLVATVAENIYIEQRKTY